MTTRQHTGSFRLDGKVAVVTGGTRGIGRAIAAAFLEAGACVVVAARKQGACDEAARALNSEQGAGSSGEAIGIACHVGREPEQAALVERTQEQFGRIDVLVCNAATNPVYGPLQQVPAEVFDKVVHTNVRSNFTLCQRVCPGMAERGEGVVILMSSIAALRGDAVIGMYGISKAAQAALARNLAVEWGPSGIRVNAIAPGLIKTDFARALWEDPVRAATFTEATPLRRLGEPTDVAAVALFLASDASRFVTGQVVVVDGGRTVG